jgi:uncharacterized protein (TIGR00369 family)
MNKEKDDFKNLFLEQAGSLPLHRFLGITSECFDVAKGCIRFDMREELVGNRTFNILHGGVIAAVLDSLGGFILAINGAWRLTERAGAPPVVKGGTIDLRVDYLRPGKGKHFIATGTILRQGNKVAVVSSELRNDLDELIAVGMGTYLIG